MSENEPPIFSKVPPLLWGIRALLASGLFLAAPPLERFAREASPAAGRTVGTAAVILWAVAAISAWWRRPAGLTALRISTGLSAAVVAVAVASQGATTRGVIALVVAGITAIACQLAICGQWFLNGASYGNEIRIGLRPPLTVAVAAPALFGGPAAAIACGTWAVIGRHWVLGTAAIVVGAAALAITVLAYHRLSGRALVFVPRGITVVDPLSLAEPAFMGRQVVTTVTLADTASTEKRPEDLALGAAGTHLSIGLSPAMEIARIDRSSREAPAAVIPVHRIEVAPSMPAAALELCVERGLTVVLPTS